MRGDLDAVAAAPVGSPADTSSPPGAEVPRSEAILEVEHITVEFPGIRALDDVHFDVRAGEVHALVGENGAGKSTFLKVLGGVHVPSRGRIRLAGQPFAG